MKIAKTVKQLYIFSVETRLLPATLWFKKSHRRTVCSSNKFILNHPDTFVTLYRSSKFSKYKTLPSFKEYVLVEQEKPSIETWFREAPGLWRETIVSDLKETVWLESIGVGIALEEVYENIGFGE